MSVKHGSRVEVLFDGNPVGVLTNFAPNEDTGMQPVYGIGHLQPQELATTRYTGTFSFTKLLVSDAKVQDIGWIESDQKTLSQISESFLTRKGFNIWIKDKYTNQVLKTYSGCKVASRGMNVTENAIIMENGNGQFLDASEPNTVQ